MIEVERLSFQYVGANANSLNDVNLKIKEGEFILVLGRSGCGKSTLCRALNGLIPHFYGGRMSGHVVVDGMDTRDHSPCDYANLVGMVFQDPENQLVMTNVENEMAFGMENMCVPTETMRERVLQYSEYLDLKQFLTRFIPELSGGEKQKVAMASILAMRPKYIVLDEPTSQLDGDNAVLFLEFLKQMNRELGISVILVEHRVERCIDYPDRIIVMDQGSIVKDGPRDEMVDYMKGIGLLNAPESRNVAIPDDKPDIIEADNISFGYEGREVLKCLGLKVKTGELVSITGDNGSGKSTLMKNLNGLLRPRTGDVKVNGKSISGLTSASIAKTIGYLGQNPNDYLFEESLEAELQFTLRNLKIDEKEWDERIHWALRILDLERYLKRFPRDLSCGERERAALASILVAKPKVLILDEPTRGLDQWNKAKLGDILEKLRAEGQTTILVTHDYRFIAEYSSRVLRLKDGCLTEISLDDMMAIAKEELGVV
ncbi:MAG TPA: energy-coupling factor transporter ATPase [Methanomassiliicoccales archaeon]|jgi:energy-coupling factor transport system ATP-binding protein